MLFTSESVSAGHPDKMADLISDSILDEILTQDPFGRVAVETLLSSSGITLAGEITSKARINFENMARQAIKAIDPEYEAQASFANHIVEQSPDIAEGIADGGAGDQGMMFGYSTNETPERLPLPIALANRIIRRLDDVRDELTYLLADAKAQVTVDYSTPKPEVSTVILSTRHEEGVSLSALESQMFHRVITPAVGEYFGHDTVIHVNPAGDFVLGGPLADTGLTGRKIIVDTYGG